MSAMPLQDSLLFLQVEALQRQNVMHIAKRSANWLNHDHARKTEWFVVVVLIEHASRVPLLRGVHTQRPGQPYRAVVVGWLVVFDWYTTVSTNS
jgi:hypothetical protein